MRTPLAVAVLLVASLAVPTTTAQVESCGELELFIWNEDLRFPDEDDGKFHVAGDFFMQFQVQGDGAEAIETFAFSVGLPHGHPPEQICEAPLWWGGLMLEAYKADFDKEDGFYILMTTTGQTTPQKTDLSVAVHGYDAAGTEVARFWGTAVVESCAGPVPSGGCAEEDVVANDNVAPWPILLPGDGSKSYVTGFTVEVAEELSDLQVFLNGEDVTDQMSEWGGRDWDRDTFWDYGPMGMMGTAAPMCSQSVPGAQSPCGPPPKGQAWQWTLRELTDDDVVKVVTTDLAGNTATKQIHMAEISGGTLGGGIPQLNMNFDEVRLTGAPRDTVVFSMTMENQGTAEGHPFVRWQEGDYPAGWPEPTWEPGHEPVPPKGTSQQELHVTIPEEAEDGSYSITARMEYSQGAVQKSVQSIVQVEVVTPEDFVVDSGGEEEVKESPGAGFVVLVLFVAAMAMLRRRV